MKPTAPNLLFNSTLLSASYQCVVSQLIHDYLHMILFEFFLKLYLISVVTMYRIKTTEKLVILHKFAFTN